MQQQLETVTCCCIASAKQCTLCEKHIYCKFSKNSSPTPIYLRALSPIVASQIYALVVKFTSVPKLRGRDGGSSQCWQCQDLESVYLCNCSQSLCRPKWMNFQKISKRPQVRTLIITFTNLIIWTKEAWTEVLSL